MSKFVEKVIPILWDNWDEMEVGAVLFYSVEFIEDWGPFKKGYKTSSLLMDIQRGIVATYNEDGTIETNRIDVILIPKV